MKRLYLHYGMHKTGSTSIQNYLDRNESFFADKGFDQRTSSTMALTIFPSGPFKRLGFGAHTDPGVLTMLAQAKDQKPGLEVCLPDGTWVRPTPVPHAILLNPGASPRGRTTRMAGDY